MKIGAAIGGCLLLVYTALTFGVLALVLGGVIVAREIGEWLALAHLRANGVRVGPDQYPALDAMAENFAGRMGIARPEIFVVQQTLWNAFAARFVGTYIVVLYSGAIDSLLLGGRPEDLGFLLGHELGHHAAGHLKRLHRVLGLAFFVPFLPASHRRCGRKRSRLRQGQYQGQGGQQVLGQGLQQVWWHCRQRDQNLQAVRGDVSSFRKRSR